MSLKFKLDSLDGVDESLASHYQEQEGKYYLNVEGAVSKSKLDEFRDNNIELTNQLKTYEGIDVEAVKTLQSDYDKLKKSKSGLSEEEVDNMVNERVKRMKSGYEKDIKTLSEENATSKAQLEVLVIDNTVRTAASKHKVLDTAISDVVLRAKTAFKMKDGVAKAYDKEGHVIFGKDGETPLTINEWVKDLNNTAPHLFTPSTGAGAPGFRGKSVNGKDTASPLSKISSGLAANAN